VMGGSKVVLAPVQRSDLFSLKLCQLRSALVILNGSSAAKTVVIHSSKGGSWNFHW
jgi:hypothetical protein